MRIAVIGSLLVLSTTSALAEYRESWVNPGELKKMEAQHKSARIEVPPKAQSKSKFVSPRARDPQGRASGQSSSDPIAAYAHDGGGASVPRKSHAASPPARQAKVVGKKAKEPVSHTPRMKTATASMV
ncbi:hypothetical protein [Burkholderia ubonensis]|uniref:hypothetical protein n=1 Tax=Burkholderia ubonensis TaxID=101571 RepID=UPI0012FA9908|nr:hypothetical protein [Burkholderia ubonensis]